MLDSDYLPLWCALNRLIANYWAEVDENGGEQAIPCNARRQSSRCADYLKIVTASARVEG